MDPPTHSPQPQRSSTMPSQAGDDSLQVFGNGIPGTSSYSNSEYGGEYDTHNMTLKDRQDAINIVHPFGLKLWKPALYKKVRTITITAEESIRNQAAGEHQDAPLLRYPGNIAWAVGLGWILALVYWIAGGVIFIATLGNGIAYSKLMLNMGIYLLWPFGKVVERLEDEDPIWFTSDQEARLMANGGQPTQQPRAPRPSTSRTGRGSRGARGGGSGERQPLLGRTSSPIEEESTMPSGPSSTFNPYQRPPTGRSAYTQHHSAFSRTSELYTVSGLIFRICYMCLVAPIQCFMSALCWFLILPLPMSKVLYILMKNLIRTPMAIRLGSSQRLFADPTMQPQAPASVVLCVFQAGGKEYLKYTVDGVNILFVNMLGMVVFTIVDGWILEGWVDGSIASPMVVFVLGLLSTVPLAFFIGMAVASISSQASLGLGAVVNATFGSIIEIILFAIMIKEGKSSMVYGSMIGNILAALLMIPGLSMLGGGLQHKEQQFNAKSAGVTATMLIFALIGVFAPTLYNGIYGTNKLVCQGGCNPEAGTCDGCEFLPVHPLFDPNFKNQVEPFMIFCIAILPTAYGIGLIFTLKTHVETVYYQFEERKTEFLIQQPKYLPPDEGGRLKVHTSMSSRPSSPLPQTSPGVSQPVQILDEAGQATRPSPIMNKMGCPVPTTMGASPKVGNMIPEAKVRISSAASVSGSPGVIGQGGRPADRASQKAASPPEIDPFDIRRSKAATISQDPRKPIVHVHRLAGSSYFQSDHLHRINARPAKISKVGDAAGAPLPTTDSRDVLGQAAAAASGAVGAENSGGGHNAPEWSRLKSTVVLLTCTLLFAIIAEVLVKNVVELLGEDSYFAAKEKFLGVTLFALVPSTTEIVNAISFATQGNFALSLEIGSAYALQVCLIQVPVVAAFSVLYNYNSAPSITHSFLMMFPNWDVIATFLSVFLITYVYIEGKSNYFKGSILFLAYATLVVSYWFVPKNHYAE